MKIHWTLGLLLLSAPGWTGTNAFTGRFGGTFEYPVNWKADATMKGPAEAIGLHPATVKPRPSDYDDLRNYRTLGLVQVLAIPKASSGPLARYAQAQLAELGKQKGVRIERMEVDGKRWPKGSLFSLIGTSKKVWVWRVFAETSGHVLVITAGRDKKAEEGAELVGRTLGAYLVKARAEAAAAHELGESDWLPADSTPLRHLFPQPRWTVWLIINGLCALLIGAAGPAGLKRAGTIGWSILAFGNGTTFLVSLGIWAAAALHLPASSGAATFGPIWLMPAACFLAARRSGSAQPMRVLAVASALAAVLLGGAAYLQHLDPGWPAHLTQAPFIGYYVGVAFGLAFGLSQT